MFHLDELAIPIIAAPMAGGPSTVDLVTAVSGVGGLGMVAGGDCPADALAASVRAVRDAGVDRFGVNLMVPGDPSALTVDRANAVKAYRTRLQPWADRYGVNIPDADPAFRDDWDAKIALLLADPVTLVTFIFGCPAAETIAALRERGSAVGVTVTNVDDAVEAKRRGADVLIVQGPLAGGHQGTWAVDAPVNTLPLDDVLRAVREAVDAPLVAAGGLSTGADIRRVLDLGAAAVQIGTALLRSAESGASDIHRVAMVSGAYGETLATRSFSGRVARGLRNAFMDDLDAYAPAAYPEVNQMTKAIRAAARSANDPDAVSMWAGVGFAQAQDRPAADIVRELWRDAAGEVEQ